MVYFPSSPPPSPTARDLSKQVDQLIHGYCARHQGVRPLDVQRALQLSAAAYAPAGVTAGTIRLTAAGLIAAFGIALVVSQRQHAAGASGSPAIGTPTIWIAIAVLAAAAGVAIALRRRMGR